MDGCIVKIGDRIANARVVLHPRRGRISKQRISTARAQITAKYGVRGLDIHVYAHGDGMALYFVKPVFKLLADDVEAWRGYREPDQHQVDSAARWSCERGWNGVMLDLYRDSEWVRHAQVSPEVLD
jgi:hypothetical protein